MVASDGATDRAGKVYTSSLQCSQSAATEPWALETGFTGRQKEDRAWGPNFEYELKVTAGSLLFLRELIVQTDYVSTIRKNTRG